MIDARSIRWTLRARLAEHPSLYLPLARRRYPGTVIGADTRLVIDGFTRSAVTFATIAFQFAQRSPVRVAHTLHAPAHLMIAARQHVPTLVMIREPEGTVLSTVIREPYVSIEQALVSYTRFYDRLMPFRDSFVAGDFETVTHDFAVVIRRVNDRFGTSFDEFEHTSSNVERCYEIIEDRSRRPPWSAALGAFESGSIGLDEYQRVVATSARERSSRGEVPESRVPRPSKGREDAKAALRVQLRSDRLADRLRSAEEMYRAFVGPATGPRR